MKKSTRHDDLKPALMRIDAAADYLDVGRSKIYQLIREGQLETVKFGHRSIRIMVASLDKFIESLPPSPSASPSALADYVVRNWPLKGASKMASFQDILNRKASDIKPPPAYPVGTYHCLVDGPPAAEQSSQKGTDCRVYKFKILSPGQDVNQNEIAQIEGGVTGKIITGQPHAAFYITEGSVWRYKEFLVDALAIQEKKSNGEEKTLMEMEAEAAGKQVLVKLKHEASQDGKRIVHRIDGYARV